MLKNLALLIYSYNIELCLKIQRSCKKKKDRLLIFVCISPILVLNTILKIIGERTVLYMGALMYLAAQILLIIRDLIFRFFYAMENTKDTVSNSIISCVFNIIMSLILVKPLGMYGVILGTFISGAISMVMILFRMKKLYGLEKFGLNLFELIKNIIVLVISVFAIILIKKHIIIENDVMAILIYGVLTVIIFVILAIIFKLKAIKIKL